MGWYHDFCLSCDRQTSGGPYCSQACRLTDLEKGSPGVEASSASGRPGFEPDASSSGRPTSARSPGFYLAPPFDFTPYRSKPSSDSSLAAVKRSSLSKMETAEFWDAFWTDKNKERSLASDGRAKAGLTPSSSQSSLSSMQSFSTQEDGALSDQNRAALRAYADSFDRVRAWKRRTTVS